MTIKELIANCVERPTRQIIRCKYCKNKMENGILNHDPECTVLHLKAALLHEARRESQVNRLFQDLEAERLRSAELEQQVKLLSEPPPPSEVVASEPPPRGYWERFRSWLS